MKNLTKNPNWIPVRYSKIFTKCPREIVMLRGLGCFWQNCTFCDYHLDCSSDADDNYHVNQAVLAGVTGEFGRLEVINSGSFPELDEKTQTLILDVCRQKKITHLYIEAHYHYRHQLAAIRARFAPIEVRVKLGVETFDIEYREKVMKKGIGNVSAEQIAADFEDCCLLIGIKGQTQAQLVRDFRLAEKYFDRICINVFIPNQTGTKADPELIEWFLNTYYQQFEADDRYDVLLDNNAFGVGGICT